MIRDALTKTIAWPLCLKHEHVYALRNNKNLYQKKKKKTSHSNIDEDNILEYNKKKKVI